MTSQTITTISADLLVNAVGCTPENAERYADPISETVRRYEINTPGRLAAFLAQIGHESASFRYAREIWGPTPAQARYEGREDLGNVEPGDGATYCGRGLIQITGRANYSAVASALECDFVSDPQKLESPRYAALSAGWYWHSRSLNDLADAGQFDQITRRINGGMNGAEDRRARYVRARRAIDDRMPSAEPQQAAAPVEESQPVTIEETTDMAPFAMAALPSLIKAAPDLIRIFGGKKSEQNAQAAEVVAKIAKDATAARTVEEAVSRIESEPDSADAFRREVRMSMGDLLMLAEAEEKSRDAAMARNAGIIATDSRWIWVLGGIAVAVVMGSYAIAYIVITGEFDDATKGMVINGVVITSLMVVMSFLFGSSYGSRAKDVRRSG